MRTIIDILKCRCLLIFWLLFLISFSSSSQIVNKIYYYFTDSPPTFNISALNNSNNDVELDSIILTINDKYLNNGYIDFSIDSIIKDSSIYHIYIHSGKKYKLYKTVIIPNEFSAYSKKYIPKRNLTPAIIKLIDSNTLINVQDKGYPYAVLNKEYKFNGKYATILYKVNPNKYVTFDTIKTSPSKLISYNYLSKTTGIEAGKPYNASAIKNLERNLNQNRLFKLDSAYINMYSNQALVTLKLKKISQNSFSGLIGLQTNDDKKTEITGNASILLVNAFKKGEKIHLDWQKPGVESQQLETSFSIPYIFNIPLGVSFYGNFDKQDTSFTNIQLKTGILMPTVNCGELSVIGKWLNSSVNRSKLPELNSTKSSLYGIGYSYSIFHNPLLPKRGFLINSQIYFGNNTIINTGKTNSKTLLFEWIGNIAYTFSLPYGSIYVHNYWAIMQNDSLKLNNLYRMGGIKSIRGFNERSIYSKIYNYANTEYRIYLNSESYMYLLYDVGLFYEPDSKHYANVFRQSIGAGLSIKTQAGILSVIFAIGKKGSDQFFINNGKIHIGYINRF